MFGVHGSGDTSGYGGLVVTQPPVVSSPRPYGGYFDDVADSLQRAWPDVGDALEAVVVHRGELTLHVKREHLVAVARTLRDDAALRFEMCTSVSGVDYPNDATGRRLHVTYQLASMTHKRWVRLEVAAPESDPQVPSVVGVWPSANWDEREGWDLFGVVFDGHPGLTRIEMPDDWPGHPQRKDYPLGGVDVTYKGARIPPPDERRAYA
jgi:NADH-quinone oxidoreductase subunit C